MEEEREVKMIWVYGLRFSVFLIFFLIELEFERVEDGRKELKKTWVRVYGLRFSIFLIFFFIGLVFESER